MLDINIVANYICLCLIDAGDTPSVLKLHKLLYYVQSWHLALNDEPMFDEKFQAWVHGPVSRVIYDRFKDSKSMYSQIDIEDLDVVDLEQEFLSIPEEAKEHIENVLESYGDLSGVELERLTHKEDPWIKARCGIPKYERSENYISEDEMKKYYEDMITVE
jgi:uncharacterized phage-associated protein